MTKLKSEKVFNPYVNIDSILDEIEKAVGLSEDTLNEVDRLSTGNLIMDLLLGGGITAAWYTNFGQEQSCKTTAAITMMSSAVINKVPICYYFDYEGSGEPVFLENIFRNMGIKDKAQNIFGVKDKKGEYIINPKIRYRSEPVAEKFFDTLSKLLRTLPDKKRIGDNWYYIYDGKTADGKIHKRNQDIVGDNYDIAYFRKTGNYRIPATDGQLQALVLLDSYPAMLPEKQDVDDPNSAIGVQARMFSEQIKRVKGRIKSKRVAVIGINQLRLKPMVMMGNPEYEPCGEALKFNSDCRMKFTSRALSAVKGAKGKGSIEEENSVSSKGKDTYRYIHVRTAKNKTYRPYIEGFIRLWISDAKGKAMGFDPVFDTYSYLQQTGQLIGSRTKSMRLALNSGKQVYESKPFKWMDFKELLLGSKEVQEEIIKEFSIPTKDLREYCFRQMSTGLGIDLFNEYISTNAEEVLDETE